MDREKVIKGLSICNSLTDICYNHGCPYYNGVQDICGEIEDVGYSSGDCKEKLHNDAIALLKEQEKEIAFLKAMQLQIVKNMDKSELGRIVKRTMDLFR